MLNPSLQKIKLKCYKLLSLQATFASKVEVKDDKLGVTREVDGGLEMIDVKMPCIITADLRYAGMQLYYTY